MAQPLASDATSTTDNYPTDGEFNITRNIVASLPENSFEQLIDLACQDGPMAIVNAMVTDPRVDISDHNMIRIAADNSQCEIVQLLLGSKLLDIGQHGAFALELSCQVGDEVTTQKIINNPNLNWAFSDHLMFHAAKVGVDPIYQACRLGRTAIVRILLEDGRIFSGMFGDKLGPLHAAAQNGHCDIVHLLVQDEQMNPGLDLNFAFQYYCAVGDMARIRAFQAIRKVDPSWEDSNCNTALKLACRYGRDPVVEMLLANPQDKKSLAMKILRRKVKRKYATGQSASLNEASKNGHVSIVKLLLADARTDARASNTNPLILASENGHISVVKLFLTNPRTDPSVQDNVAVVKASQNGHASVLELLLADSRTDPSAQENEAIVKASQNGHIKVVNMLLKDPRVDASAQDNAGLRNACEYGHTSVVEVLLNDPRVQPSAQDNNAVILASKHGHVEVVKLLLADSRVDPTAQNNEAVTLACTSHNRYELLINMLLDDSRVVASKGEQCALKAAVRSTPVAVRMLLKRPGIVVTREVLVNADEAYCDAAIELLIASQPHAVSRLCFDGVFVCNNGARGESLRNVFWLWERRSAMTLLLSVKRTQTKTVAGRVSDVLHEVLSEFSKFRFTFSN